MHYRVLGNTGLLLSSVGLGTWINFANILTNSKAESLIKSALDWGVNHIDCAETYAFGQAEEQLGNIISNINFPRDQLIICSKVYWGGEKVNQCGLSRKRIYEACNASLRRLKREYIDIYYCHRLDPSTSIENIVFAMNDLIRQGKILFWGTSEWPATKILEAYYVAKLNNLIPPTVEQAEYNMFARHRVERDLLDVHALGVAIISCMPLACGILTGKYLNGQVPGNTRASVEKYEWMRTMISTAEGIRKLDFVEKLNSIAKNIGMSLSQLAICWCLRLPYLNSLVFGSRNVHQLQENVDAINKVQLLTNDVIHEIDLILKNKPDHSLAPSYEQIKGMV